jgi:endo-1,4-beta-xylanase
LLSLLALWSFAIAQAASPPATLRDAAQQAGILIGAAARPAQLSELSYAATLAREFSMLEPEDALKWDALRPGPRSFDFRQADQLVEFATHHHMKIRGHTLVWHRQNPQWLAEGSYTPTELARLLETHIRTIVGHYKGKIFAWDVVNEAFDEGPRVGELRSTIWSRISLEQGPTSKGAPSKLRLGGDLSQASQQAESQISYIAQCFRWAHEADPGALLFYNDAEAEEINKKSDAIYAMIRDFKRQGVPIDGVGLQMHIANRNLNLASISADIARFTALGVQVHITELDVSLPVDSNGNATAADLQRQAEIYRQIAEACLAHPGCTAIQMWGFTDKYSWIVSHSKKTRGSALLFDRNYRPKPSYEALRNALTRAKGR